MSSAYIIRSSADTATLQILPACIIFVKPLTDYSAPFDGTCITLATLNILPTSCGLVHLAFSDLLADPLIDSNYYATETNRLVMRTGVRMVIRAVETPEGQSIVDEELQLPLRLATS
jgi:hypothetical protein